MPAPKKISNFLDKVKIKYEPVEHRTVYTAFDKAATLKVSEKIVGKTLVVRTDKEVALVLIPANKNLDIRKLGKKSGMKKISFVKEAWVKKNLKGAKVGAIPPFGNLWGLPTFIDKSLIGLPKIILNSGNYNLSIKIKGTDLKKLMVAGISSHLPPRLKKQGLASGMISGNFSKARK
jgi:Ala-tRNA(Pro) deacylase